MSVSTQMPKYKCHKEVYALKIKSIVKDGEGENRETDGSAIITPEEEGYAPFRVDYDYINKHKPQVGGYYVVYKDGYKSFSPAEAFESGYSVISYNSDKNENILLEALEIIANGNPISIGLDETKKLAQTAINKYNEQHDLTTSPVVKTDFDCGATPQTDFEKVVQIIDEARKLHFDNKTPSDIDVEIFYKYAYAKLFGYRDTHQTVLSAPQRHNLVEVFKELKFGRPSEDQKALQDFIDVLQGLEIKHDKDFNGLLSCGKATFGMAIEALKEGKKVARKGWNGKGMYLILFKGQQDIAKAFGYGYGELQGEFQFVDVIAMKSATDTMILGWLASQTDMLSEDWEIVG